MNCASNKRVVSKSNFLFVKETLYAWKDLLYNDSDLNKLPKTISDIYES